LNQFAAKVLVLPAANSGLSWTTPASNKGHAMKYYLKVLQPDEHVKFVGKLHWIIYLRSIMFGIFTVGAVIFSFDLPENQKSLALSGSGMLAILTVIFFLWSWVVRWTTEIVVTDKRVIHKVGLIVRHTQEMNISKVETVDVNQGILARILGYGQLLIRGIGSSWEPLRFIASPLELRNAIIVG
jgi:membrane protein YdbS with pleckstrin-like domain